MRTALVSILSLTLAGCATIAAIKGDESVQVQGRTLAYARAGNVLPTVIFESGLGDGKDTWSLVAPRIAKIASVLTYDRAGYGASSIANDGRSAAQVVNDLRELLSAGRLKPPYVLVGHSLGGLYMQYFARQYPNEVAGLVLVDSSHWQQEERMTKELPGTMNTLRLLSYAMKPTERAEFHGSSAASLQVRDAPAPTDMAVVVLTGSKRNVLERGKFAEVWNALQQDLVASYRAEHVIAELSGHYVQRDQPNLVIAAISRVVARSVAGK